MSDERYSVWIVVERDDGEVEYRIHVQDWRDRLLAIEHADDLSERTVM